MIEKINILLLKTNFQTYLKVLNLILFLILLYFGFSVGVGNDDILIQLRNTNLSNLIVWSYWWPLIIIGAIFFGRIWCMVCPVETISSIFAKFGLKKKRNSFIKNGWLISIFYLIILIIGINILAVHRDPFYMAVYLSAILIVAIVVGIIYEKNTFCAYVCPVGNILGLYSKFSFIGWRVNDKLTCHTCKDKSCVHKKHTYNLINKSCGVDIYPEKINDNSACILCSGCLKTCNKYNSSNDVNRANPGFSLIGFAKDLFINNNLKTAEVLFLFIVTGFVTYEILSEFKATNDLLMNLPNYIIQYFNIDGKILKGLIKSLFLFIIIPSIFWGIPYLIYRAKSDQLSLIEYFKKYSIIFLPIIASAHLSKSLLKMSSRIPYVQDAIKDPLGIDTANKILSSEIVLAKIPSELNYLISFIMLSVFFSGIYYSFKLINLKKDLNSSFSLYVATFFYASIFILTILIWRIL